MSSGSVTPPNPTARRLTAALLLGAAGYGAGKLLQRALREAQAPPSEALDWEAARRVAARLAGGQGVRDRAGLEARYRGLVERSASLIADYLGVSLPGPPGPVHVLDRREWLEANFQELAATLAPLDDLFRARRGGRAAGTQLGFLFGLLARRVLGQYSLGPFSPDAGGPGSLYFVEPNIARAERLLGLGREDFRFYLALHEVTHAYEFEVFPWVRPYSRELLRELLAGLSARLRRRADPVEILGRLARGVLEGQPPSLALLSPEERRTFDRLQALMSLAEGYANHVTKEVGKRLPGFEKIERRVRARQQSKSPVSALLGRLSGMELKLAQYREGEAFADAVAARRGVAFLNRAWERPEHLPSLAEIRDPRAWIARMEA